MLVVVFLFICVLRPVTAIRLDGNGYSDIIIVISPAVPENEELLNQIKEMITSGSEYLFEALDYKVFFKDVKILVPPNWTSGKYERARTETFNKGRIRIDSPHNAVGDIPYTHQTSGCGREGEYIHFTPNYLLNDNVSQAFGPKGRVFVHEWAHLRWGVFDEYNVREPFYLSSGQILPTRCSKVSGQWYETINKRRQRCQIGGDGKLTSNCEFFPDEKQHTNSSIMFIPALDSVKAFCNEEEHNTEAPNEQNKKCAKATRTVIFQDSVDKDALQNLKPLQSKPPAPTFKILQRGPRTVCLVLDVSRSMDGSRIKLQQQAATVFLNQIINEQEFVALVTFSTEAQILNPLTLIDGKASRDGLINKLPTIARGATYICKGLRKGLEALQMDDGKTTGDEILFLTDGEATDNVAECLQKAVQSGAIIHTIAFGPNADNVLKTMSDQTDGKFIVAGDSLSSNQLVDAFSSVTIFDGDSITQPVQIESIGKNVDDWFNGTVTVDQTIGNHTTFTLIYERTAPTMYIESPSGLVYDQKNTPDIANTITFIVTGTAEPGVWKYSFFNIQSNSQQMSLTVMSRAAREDVHPVTVTVRTSQQTSDGIETIIVLAEFGQKYNPVLEASVQVNLESHTGYSAQLQLLDNGAGPDTFKDDGTYSRYFPNYKRGKYSIRVRVETYSGGVQVSPHRYSGALYVPGYIVDGEVKLNPPKPPVTVQPVDVGRLTRTATGESFVVKNDAPNFPPNKITDLIAELQEDFVFLNWTAPGEDLDQGTAQSYEIRWSEELKTLQKNLSSSNLVNTSTVQPQESGSAEQHSFQLSILIRNGTTVFFAVQAVDRQSVKSEVSNIARATYYVPSPTPSPSPNPKTDQTSPTPSPSPNPNTDQTSPTPSPSPNPNTDQTSPTSSPSPNPNTDQTNPTPDPGPNLTAIIVSLCVLIIVICVIAVIIKRARKQKRHSYVPTLQS